MRFVAVIIWLVAYLTFVLLLARGMGFNTRAERRMILTRDESQRVNEE